MAKHDVEDRLEAGQHLTELLLVFPDRKCGETRFYNNPAGQYHIAPFDNAGTGRHRYYTGIDDMYKYIAVNRDISDKWIPVSFRVFDRGFFR